MNRPVTVADTGPAVPLSVAPSRPELAPGWPEAAETAPATALVIDPDAEVGSSAALHMLRQNGVAIDQVASAEAAMEAIARRRYRLVILELAAGEYDGADLCRRIVERQGPPVLVWSTRAAPLDQVAGLELGADDYVAKTAHPLELLARTRAILRRGRAAGADAAAAADRQLGPGAWLFDPRVNSIRSWNGARVWLRPASSALLRIFCDQPRQQIAREDLLRGVSRGEAEVALRTIDVMVSRLRRSLEACDGGGYLIRTVRPKGYLLDATVQMADGGTLIRG